MTKFVIYDVFSETPFGGNQLSVIPDARNIPETDLQNIAREFNYSETTFVYPPNNAENTAKVRIFTPTSEINFAGHPTVGTAIALRDLGMSGDMILELGIGPIPCRFSGNEVAFTTSAPLERISEPTVELVARALGLAPEDIDLTTHAPIQVSLGLPFVIAELKTKKLLSKSEPVIDALREGAKKHPAGLDFAIFVYVRNGKAVDARMFAPLDNIPEDPATGSACATLAALLHELSDTPQNLNIRQGEDMNRLSLISATTQGSPVQVTIHGTATKTMEGELVY